LFNFKILSFFHVLTCLYTLYIIWATSPPPPGQNLFHPLVLFCWGKNIKDNRKNMHICMETSFKNSWTKISLRLSVSHLNRLQSGYLIIFSTQNKISIILKIVDMTQSKSLHLSKSSSQFLTFFYFGATMKK
jgi:hypothetical protein